MTTAAPSTALATIQPAFTDAECLAPRRVPGQVPPCGMTGPAAAWTGMRPTSLPPTSQAPPGNTSADHKLCPAVAAAGRSCPAADLTTSLPRHAATAG
jgi:hypothetical protein